MVVTWLSVTWVMLGAELAFALWAWRYSSIPLVAALVVTLGIVYFDLPSVPLHSIGFVALFLVPVPFIEHVVSLRRGIIASDKDALEWRGDEHPASARKIVEFFDQQTLAMRGLRFRYAGDFVETSSRDGVAVLTFTRLFVGSDMRERATFQGVVTRDGQRERATRPTLSVASDLENGERFITTNARSLFPFQGVNGEWAAAVPRMRTPEALLQVHRARIAQSGSAADRQPTPHDWVSELRDLRRAGFNALVQRRYCARVGASEYRMTWRGAWRLASTDCPVLRPFLWFSIRKRQKMLLAELRNPLPRAARPEQSQDQAARSDQQRSAQSA